MTIRAEIIGDEGPQKQGWVEVDPFDYEYNGPDPDGEIEAYLEGVADGTVTFEWPEEAQVVDGPVPADLRLIQIKQVLQSFDAIWFIDLPTGWNPETITYG